MLILLSPAKRLKEENPKSQTLETTPVFQEFATEVQSRLRKLSPKKLRELQGISQALAEENALRNQEWGSHDLSEKAFYTAIELFNGDAYLGLDAATLSDQDLSFAQRHLRILSGLYGLLRPLDRIEPYRLEMGTTLKIGRKNNLYAYWGERVTSQIKEEYVDNTIVNLASNEYSKVIDRPNVGSQFIDVVFKDRNKNGAYKVMSFYAKKARGMMARYIIKNKLEDPASLLRFDMDGYYFSANESSPTKLVFLRDH